VGAPVTISPRAKALIEKLHNLGKLDDLWEAAQSALDEEKAEAIAGLQAKSEERREALRQAESTLSGELRQTPHLRGVITAAIDESAQARATEPEKPLTEQEERDARRQGLREGERPFFLPFEPEVRSDDWGV